MKKLGSSEANLACPQHRESRIFLQCSCSDCMEMWAPTPNKQHLDKAGQQVGQLTKTGESGADVLKYQPRRPWPFEPWKRTRRQNSSACWLPERGSIRSFLKCLFSSASFPPSFLHSLLKPRASTPGHLCSYGRPDQPWASNGGCHLFLSRNLPCQCVPPLLHDAGHHEAVFSGGLPRRCCHGK